MKYEQADKDSAATSDDNPLDTGRYDEVKAENWGIALGYTYAFSKRTNLYTYVSYTETKKTIDDASAKTKFTEYGLGIKHSF